MVYLFLADGFETIEALAPLDVLRRAKIEVQTVGVTGKVVYSSHQVPVTADLQLNEINTINLEGILLPGGGVGTENLKASPVLHQMIDYCVRNKLLVAAICAAPSILGDMGLLKDRRATAYPGFQEGIGQVADDFVVKDGQFITARGAGVSIEFGFAIIEYLRNKALADEIKALIQCAK